MIRRLFPHQILVQASPMKARNLMKLRVLAFFVVQWFEGKEKLLSLGTYPETSLAEAREKHAAARKQLQAGIDPGAARLRKSLVLNVPPIVSR